MEIKKCLVIDSELDSFYVTLLKKLPFIEFETCSNADEALRHVYSKRGIDLVIVNISSQSDQLNNFIKQMYRTPPVIVISDSEKKAIQAFDIDNVVDILLVPFDKNRLLRALSKAWGVRHTEHSVSDSESVFLKCGRMMKRFFFDHLEYVEAYGVYSKVYYEGTKIIVNESISSIEHLLSKRKFRRVHKSFIININNIQEIDSAGVLLINTKTRVPFGPKYKPLLGNLFKLHNTENQV